MEFIPSSPETNKIYTRSGDIGTTGLRTGGRVSKSHARIQAYGAVDELNSILGAARAHACHSDIPKLLERLQHKVMAIASLLATKEPTLDQPLPQINEADIAGMERCIDYFTATLPPLNQFILPGQNPSSAWLDIARTTPRRAERAVVALAETEIIDPILRKFLNRLSDLMFTLERAEYHFVGQSDKFWTK